MCAHALQIHTRFLRAVMHAFLLVKCVAGRTHQHEPLAWGQFIFNTAGRSRAI
jgi:hypothetical protein